MNLPSQITLAATQKNLSRFVKFVSDFAEGLAFSHEKINDIRIATEEALINIINYAYSVAPGDATVVCRVDEADQVVIEIIDNGEPFDIGSAEAPDVDADILSRKVGGLGILLINELMDGVTYRREAHSNILKLTIRKSSIDNAT